MNISNLYAPEFIVPENKVLFNNKSNFFTLFGDSQSNKYLYVIDNNYGLYIYNIENVTVTNYYIYLAFLYL